MHKFLAYTLKTLWRHRARTGLTVAGSAVALMVFCLIESVQQGMNDLVRKQESGSALVVFQARRFCPATSHLPQDYGREIGKIPGVQEVLPIQVFTNNCRASLDVVVFYGAPARQLLQHREFELEAGDWSTFESRQDAAVMGRGFAQRRRVSVGDSFSLGDLTVHVAGIFRCSDSAEENYIYTHLEFLQRRRGVDRVGLVTQLEVFLQAGADPRRVSQAIDDRFASAAVATITRPKGAFQAQALGDLSEAVSLMRWLGFACVGLVLGLVATTTLMSVQDRVREHAVLKAIGFTGLRVFGLVVLESSILAAAGGWLGIGAAILLLSQTNLTLGAEAVAIAFRPSLQVALQGAAVAGMAGVLAGIPPACYAASTAIVPSLRQAG